MKNTIFIPKTIKVGYQERKDTYTGKLSYIIYYKGNKLCKETSWNSWRDENIEPNDFENKPTEGFVLNKKVGDYKSDWNHRLAYCRVFDPRGFEFEIGIDNLIYILENTNCIKGKGLEGEFVYGWEGGNLILIPINSPDYQEINNYSELLVGNAIKAKDLIVGGTYRTNKNEEWIYLGKYNYYEYKNRYDRDIDRNTSINKGKKYWFFYYQDENSYKRSRAYQPISSLSGRIIECISNECSENYARIMDELELNKHYSPVNLEVYQFENISLEEWLRITKDYSSYYSWINRFFTNNQILYVGKYNNYAYINNANRFIVSNKYPDYYDRFPDVKTYTSLEEIYNEYKPQKRITYLMNGKKYAEEIII